MSVHSLIVKHKSPELRWLSSVEWLIKLAMQFGLFKHVSSWCTVSDPHLTAHHLNISVWLGKVREYLPHIDLVLIHICTKVCGCPQARSHLHLVGPRPSHASFTAQSSCPHLRGNSSPLETILTMLGHFSH